MARHYDSLSQKCESLEKTSKAARAMDVAAGHLPAANYWSPEGPKEVEVSALKKTKSALDTIGDGPGKVKKALGDAFARHD